MAAVIAVNGDELAGGANSGVDDEAGLELGVFAKGDVPDAEEYGSRL